MNYTLPLARLIEEFQKLPGIGPKSAQRLAFHILKQSPADVEGFSRALVEAKQQIGECALCHNVSSESPCEICASTHRNPAQVCVVPEPRDLFALERTHEYRGLYHVLQGLISPMEGIGPEELRIRELVSRLSGSAIENAPGIEEVILALPPSVEGDTTSLYLARLLKPLGMKVTRIAFGLPAGGDLEYADAMTLTRALEGRREV